MNIAALLAGGDRRSIGRSNQVVALVRVRPERFAELMRCLWSDDPIVRMRAADAAEKVSAPLPELLAPFRAELLGLLVEADQQEMRWHLAQMIPRLSLNSTERGRAIATLRAFLSDDSSIVKTCAMQALVELTGPGAKPIRGGGAHRRVGPHGYSRHAGTRSKTALAASKTPACPKSLCAFHKTDSRGVLTLGKSL
jgi:hypothetical protein